MRMMRVAAVALLALGLAGPAGAQAPPSSSTAVESASAKKGVLTSRTFGERFGIEVKYHDEVVVRSLVVSSPGAAPVKGIRIEIPDKDDADAGAIGFIDLDEVPQLIAGLNQLAQLKPWTEGQKYTEYEFDTRGGIGFGFILGAGDNEYYVEIRHQTAFIEQKQFASLTAHISDIYKELLAAK